MLFVYKQTGIIGCKGETVCRKENVMKKKILFCILAIFTCISLVGCGDGSNYNKAADYEEEGDYSAALEIYETIPDYKDSKERITYCESMISAIDSFDKAKETLNQKNSELDEEIAKAENLIAEGKTPLDEELKPALETAISDAKAAKVNVPEMPETADEISSEAKKMEEADYTDSLDSLSSAYTDLDKSIRQYELVDAPEESYVVECLHNVPDVEDISAVTEETDPNGLLNKAGSYTAFVIFSSDLVDQSDVLGDTIAEKGTACGGGVEVFANVEDAEKRDEYLGTFDGTIVRPGSHKVVGTVIVRTSDELTASQQKELEENVIAALTDLGE